MTSASATSSKVKVYALLVGIDEYPDPQLKLDGCVNDINAIEDYLKTRLATKQYELHLQRLTTNGEDEKPTRQAVISGFQQHLCQATEQDVALFYFCGHGSQEPAPLELWHLEPDRQNETLVCWDSRTSDRDLADKELAYLIAQVAEQNPHIIIILDCCHSGTGTRDILPETGVRHAPADGRARSLNEFIFCTQDLEAILSRTASKATVDASSGWKLHRGRHIVLSGCRDNESAKEYSGDGQLRGAFSYFLLDTLLNTNGSLTYRELFKRASALVRSHTKDQSPQLESTLPEDLELPFLGTQGAIAKRAPHFTVSYENERWVMDAGAVHGIPEGESGDSPGERLAPVGFPDHGSESRQRLRQRVRLALYPLGTPFEQMRQLSVAAGEAEAIEVLPHQSVVEITKPTDLTQDMVFNAIITSLPLPPLGVYFEGDEAAINLARQELQKIGFDEKPSLYVREVKNIAEAEYRLLARESQYLITKPTDLRPLVKQLDEYTPANARKAVENLEHIARWIAVVQLKGTPSSCIPTDAVKMQFLASDGTEIVNSPLRLSYQYQDGKWKPPTFRLKLTNTSEERLFCTVLDLPEDYSISAPLFEGNNRGVWIEPSAEAWAFGKKEIPASIPNELWEQGITEYQDVLKLIVSTAEFDASLMGQEGLEQPKQGTRSVPKRNSTLNRLMQRVTTRHIGAEQIDEVDVWLTSEVTVITLRPRDLISLQPDTQTSLVTGVTLHHPTLQATARLTTVSPFARDVEPILPPILRDNTQPFQFTASRGVDPGLSALELNITDPTSLNAITPKHPLTLSVDRALGENEYVLPVAYDGEFFIPLGRGQTKNGKTEIRIERSIVLDEKKRSLGGSIRIFFQKIVAQQLCLEFPYPILAAVECGVDGTNRYEANPEVVKQKVAQANKIVLFIHGIIGDTQSMLPCIRLAKIAVEGQEKSLTDIYDLVLTFDYENLNTPIETLAEQLGERLKAVGLEANHAKTLHIVAHSMGGLVARSFIEQKGGNRVVGHLIMVGTPNAGSPWSTVQDWAFTVLTIGLNGWSVSGFPLAALGNLLGAIEAIDINLDRMKPGSDFLNSLQDCADPGIPYTILAGNTSLIQPPDAETANKLQTLLRKLGRGAIEFPFLGQSNDIAVMVDSIKHVPQGRSHPPQIQDVACNHLVYFTHPEGLQALAQAVIGTGIL